MHKSVLLPGFVSFAPRAHIWKLCKSCRKIGEIVQIDPPEVKRKSDAAAAWQFLDFGGGGP
jgi:hypothetical protein